MKYKSYIQLLRPKHYLKNILVFIPLIFSGNLFNPHLLTKSLIAFVSFSMAASIVYIFNDIRDVKLDKKHSKKKHRPIASGEVSISSAITIASILFITVFGLQYFANISLFGIGLLLFYLAINIVYSMGLKNVPVVDVAILSLGFVVRVLYGGESISVEVSKWLYLAILAFSFYLGLGKRRNEIRKNGSETRRVNKLYNTEFLDKNMYVCMGLTLVYYSLWAIDPKQEHSLVFWTIPVVIVIAMVYSLTIEGEVSDGDPVSVILESKTLMLLVVIYCLLIIGLVYL